MITVNDSRKVLLLTVLLALLGAAGICASAVAGEFDEFGIESVSTEETDSRAGQHPDVALSFVYNHQEPVPGKPAVEARTKSLTIELPPGLVGDPAKFPFCTNGQFEQGATCPVDSQVGVVEGQLSESSETFTSALYNLEPPRKRGAIARFGFKAAVYQFRVNISVRTAGDYGVTATLDNASSQGALVSAKTTLWGVPASPIHDDKRLTSFESLLCGAFFPPGGFPCFAPGGVRPSGLQPKPFLNNPTACEEQPVTFIATSYQLPGQTSTKESALPPITECDRPPFPASMQVKPTSSIAGAPTGLEATVLIPQTDEVNLPATSAMRAARLTLPEGMTIASGAADGLEACSDQEVGLGTESPSDCPKAAKLGTATIVSPAVVEPIHGAIYQRTPGDGDLFRIWLVTDEMGLHLKLPGTIHADPKTGQLTTEFLDNPQLPVEEIDLDFWGGAKAPLKNPDSCGTYTASYQITPWADVPVVSGQSQMTIDQGCGSGGFSPKLNAGATNPVAGAFSPLVINLTREDGEDNVSGLEFTLAKGQLAKLKGVGICADGDALNGECPAASQIGSVTVAVGAGSQPLWIPQPGKAPTGAFLAGPYEGAPYSVVTKVPAQAGPFDLGTIAVRSGLYLDPTTTQATVKSDPLPQILEGVPVIYRALHIAIDRGQFALNPTNCEPQLVTSTVTSTEGEVAHPADRFQVGDCAALPFRPRLTLRLSGGVRRNGHPKLTAVLRPRKGDANLARSSVALPPSQLLENANIRTVCTRVQYRAQQCPDRAIYGYARAWTPLLDQPLQGPVYLRSSDHELPDLVADLGGQIDVDLVGRIDSAGGGIRTTFDEIPDAPIDKFALTLQGGRHKGLLVNSEPLCGPGNVHRATVRMEAQNGRSKAFKPRVQASCGKAKPRGKG